MSLTERSHDISGATLSLDRELEALQQAVSRARRNRWHGGDVLEPEFEQYLAALTAPRDGTVRSTASGRSEGSNPWREAIAS